MQSGHISRESVLQQPIVPPLSLVTFASLNSSDPASLLNVTARFLLANPPFNVTEDERAATDVQLRTAGLCSGTYHKPAGVNLTLAVQVASASVSIAALASSQPLGNQWARVAT
jgi:hypothetical protein